MNEFKVTFSDGNSLTTSFNGDFGAAKSYYIGKWFNVGAGPDDNMVLAVSVEILKNCFSCGQPFATDNVCKPYCDTCANPLQKLASWAATAPTIYDN